MATTYYDIELFELREDGELGRSLGRIGESCGNPHEPTTEYFWTADDIDDDPEVIAGWDVFDCGWRDDMDAEYVHGWSARWVEVTP